MKKKLLILSLLFCLGCMYIISCRPDNNITPVDNKISFTMPQGWPQPVYTFQNNALTQSGFDLGKKLFYDTRLSLDSSTSCGSCHQQFAAFSHLDHPLSHGIYGQFGHRNAPALFNIAWEPAFMWDGGVNNIENQPINPIQNPLEMGESMPHVITKLSADAAYKAMFKTVFGDETINSQRIFKALAQFMATMVSNNSRYDKYIRGDAGATLTPQELNGLSLFRNKCASCHKEPLFTDYSFRNNGLTPSSTLKDSGRNHITGDPADMYKFKVPSLRNVELSRPYMHDGRFNTLDAAVEHYRTDIYNSPSLDPLLTSGISMTDQDKQDIISFLKTLTDTTYTKDTRFKDPN